MKFDFEYENTGDEWRLLDAETAPRSPKEGLIEEPEAPKAVEDWVKPIADTLVVGTPVYIAYSCCECAVEGLLESVRDFLFQRLEVQAITRAEYEAALANLFSGTDIHPKICENFPEIVKVELGMRGCSGWLNTALLR